MKANRVKDDSGEQKMMDRTPPTLSLRAGAKAHGLRVLDGGASAPVSVTDDAARAERRRLLEEMDAAWALGDRLDDAGLRVAFRHADDATGVTVELVAGGGPIVMPLGMDDLLDLDWLAELVMASPEPRAS